jgi:hypothetical protein
MHPLSPGSSPKRDQCVDNPVEKFNLSGYMSLSLTLFDDLGDNQSIDEAMWGKYYPLVRILVRPSQDSLIETKSPLN